MKLEMNQEQDNLQVLSTLCAALGNAVEKQDAAASPSASSDSTSPSSPSSPEPLPSQE